MNNKLIVPVKDGQLIATTSTDPNYPGIDIEFIPEKENINHMSNPRVLVEQTTDDTDTNYIRAIVWNNPSQEDYSHNIKLYKQEHLTPTIHQNTSDMNRLSEICNAGKILCDFCENDNCEKCQVTNLLNDAYCEFGEDNED